MASGIHAIIRLGACNARHAQYRQRDCKDAEKARTFHTILDRQHPETIISMLYAYSLIPLSAVVRKYELGPLSQLEYVSNSLSVSTKADGAFDLPSLQTGWFWGGGNSDRGREFETVGEGKKTKGIMRNTWDGSYKCEPDQTATSTGIYIFRLVVIFLQKRRRSDYPCPHRVVVDYHDATANVSGDIPIAIPRTSARRWHASEFHKHELRTTHGCTPSFSWVPGLHVIPATSEDDQPR